MASRLSASRLAQNAKVSRRNLIGGGAALLSLMCMPAFGHSGPEGGVASVKASFDNSAHMTVEVMLNGKGPYRFVVDTGAERSVVSQSLAGSLGLAHVKNIRVEGVTGRMVTETVRIADLGLGSLHRKNMVVPVLPDSWLQADGYIGLDALGANRIVLDFARDRLSVIHGHQHDHATASGFNDKAARLKLRTRKCLVDKVEATVFIDTGAEVSVGNHALLMALKHADANFDLYRGAASLHGVAGGGKGGALLNFDKLRVADVALDNGEIVISHLPVFSHWDLDDKPALILGMDFMRRFERIMVDYRGGRFHFDFEGLRRI